MTSRLTLSVPATLTVLGGNASLSSLAGLTLGGPGPGISLSGAGPGDTISLQIMAGNTAASLGLANTSGVTASAQLNTLSLTGTQAQLNLALAGLELTEPVGAAGDVLSLSATDTAALAVQSGFTVDVVALTGPAFVAPPKIVTLQTNALTPLSGLLLADPIAAGLAAMGLGKQETLMLSLSVAEGVLLLPGLSALSGVAATGVGSGNIELSFTADEISAVNTLLAGLEFAGPAGGQHLNYAVSNETGPLPQLFTYGAIFFNVTGTQAANGVFTAGTQTLITGGTVFNGTLAVSGIDTVLGNLTGGTIEVAPSAVLEVPDGSMALSGTSADFGDLSAQLLTLSGTLFVGGTASVAGQVALLPGALLNVANGLTVFGSATSSFDVGLNMGAGAVVEGSGTLTVGNFGQSGVIDGGTLLALGGDTLEIDAGWITGNATLQVAGGGVMVLGPVSPLLGVFNTTPLTIDASVVLSFLGPGGQAVSGGYADTLGGTGGAFVIAGPQYFSGNVSGFGLGDQLIFPDLANISIYNVGTDSFQLAGLDVFGNTDTYTIHTSIAAGLAPAAGLDAEGDVAVFMRSTLATVTQGAVLSATPGIAQPLLGVSLEMPGSNTQALTITLTAGRGSLSSAGGLAASRITLTAANLAALNTEIEAVSYSGTGLADTVVFTSNAGLLAGVQGSIIISAGSTGTVSGYAGIGVTQGEMVTFGAAIGVPLITQPLAAGGVLVSGVDEFEDFLSTSGYSGTALLVDGGGEAIFGAAATVSLAGDVTLGDASGAGTLILLGERFVAGGNVTLAPVAGAAGSEAAILGDMSIAGTLDIGLPAVAAMLLEGSLGAGPLSLGAGGTLEVLGTAQAGFGSVSNNGIMVIAGSALVSASAYQGTGTLELGGTATFAVAGLDFLTGGGPVPLVDIGAGAVLAVGTLQGWTGSLDLAGLLTGATTLYTGNAVLAGGTMAAPGVVNGGTMIGYGVIDTPSLYVGGLIEAQGGRLLITGNVDNASLLEIASGATLEIGGMLSNVAANFAGANAELVLDDAAAGFFDVDQIVPGDAIDLVGIAPSLVSVSSGGAGYINNTLAFGLEQAGTAQGTISVTSDGAGGALLTVGGVLPCFARGTGILSPHGYRKVETLRPNDPVITANGERRPVRWVGWRTLDLGPEAARSARPVLIMPHAFGLGRPAKMLRLSPSHCIHIGGVLIPITQLVNGATILRDTSAQAATYFHIELDRHDILLAEGLECESYFDDGNRAAMYQELGRRCPARKPYAPVVTSGARLAAARRRLHEIAVEAGFLLRFQPALRAVAAGESAVPEILTAGTGRVARFAFSQPVRELVLLSATSCPADTDPDSDDRRELGVCLGEMKGVRLGAGWHERAPGDIGMWAGASAELGFARARRAINLPLAAIAPSWRRGPVDRSC